MRVELLDDGTIFVEWNPHPPKEFCYRCPHDLHMTTELAQELIDELNKALYAISD